MKIKNFFFIAISFCLTSCGDSATGPKADSKNADVISAADHKNLTRPCINSSNIPALAIPVGLDGNTSTIYAAEVNETINLAKSLAADFDNVLFPPTDAYSQAPDNIGIFDGEIAYSWIVGEDRYSYVLKEDGYSIRLYEDNSFSGKEILYVEQKADCSSFVYQHYANTAFGEASKTELRYEVNTGNSEKVYFGVKTYENDSPFYVLRVFEDTSGDLERRVNGDLALKINWYTEGNGTYQAVKDDGSVDSGTWAF